ncbi:MAG: hydantoinase/oxoprolinase family protein [Candidatus Korarchaeota archaeon]|nr:hydantoinase/oxoprolinase family protein [Candidatus Korarchaeota archaeon]NIU83645.1 hydantoinase/oxoprolinase family protein [Candidatus Thorarchaeota archaeon]NIW13872.1 hydantoinase/oxoprolinase family protein [Candidatus Thorarchaeota archaeon]NIW51983.1 hydantoinase/oxoprolinase family protein [Candidatus Korarchaeota archaeon]
MTYRIGVDIGGAFTDLVAYNEETGETTWVKGETTPQDPSRGVIDTVQKSKLDLSKANTLIHGQTLVINTVVERNGAKTGLITTKGFRDNIQLQRANRRDMYNLRYKKPEPFVPRYLRREVKERIMADGTVREPLHPQQVKKATKKLLEEDVDSLCVSFINSYANPEHELQAKEIVKSVADGIPVTLSHELTREWREYERTNTAVLNAYVTPRIQKYLGTLEEEIKSMGFGGTFFTMLSNGGMSTFQFAEDYPIYTIESGPVGGVMGAITLSEVIEEENIISLDGGSTTTKASLVEGLAPRMHKEYHVGRDEFRPGYPVKVPVVDTVEVGNGGTSVTWIDEIGNLKVGPKAMGAEPGPACYGKGGNTPTVTDAYVINGLINPEYLLGGEMKLHKDLAVKAVRKIADHYGISIQEAAEGIIKLANENASDAIRLVSVQRGFDPREFALVAYGGAGPMFAPFIAEELELKNIVIPTVPPGVFSAWGVLVTDIRHDLVQTNVLRLDRKGAIETINGTYEDLEDKIVNIFEDEGLETEKVVLKRFADMRYYGQEHTVRVPIFSGKLTESKIPQIIERLHEIHNREYSFKLKDSPVEIVNFHVTGISKVKKISLEEKEDRGGSVKESIKGERDVFLNGQSRTLKVYYKPKVPKGASIRGPAIIEDPTSTVLVLDDQVAECDKFGNIVISKR